jgi:translation initiation factor 5B
MIRQPIIAVMGHVDHGKTTLLDRIRNTNVVSKEAGGITQHIGASEVGIDSIRNTCGPLLSAMKTTITIPGLLFIDTPGHEAFTNLRSRGGSLADIAILVVDVSKGFEPQTVEALEILKEYKTPFIIAANKVDLITGWHSIETKSITAALHKQQESVTSELDNRIYGLIGKVSEFGINSELFSRVTDFNKEVAIVPMSAKTGEGIAELLMLVTGLAQRFLEMRLKIEITGKAKGSILEKREVKGLGITIDIILYDGSLKVNDIIAFATPNGVATAKVKALLRPKRAISGTDNSGKYDYLDMVSAASGIKISGNGLENAIPGSPVVQVKNNSDYEAEIKANIGQVFETDPTGVILKADSIGSMDAISKLMKGGGFKINRKGIGNVTKRDVMDAFTMNATSPEGTAILAFNVPLDADAEETAEMSGIKVIKSDIIYKLVEDYKAFAEEKRKLSAQRIEDRITLPGMIEVLPDSCFRASHPAIFGIEVIAGRIKPNYRVMSQDGTIIGKVKGIQNEKAPVQEAKRGDRFAISIEGPTFGRQVYAGQKLYTVLNEEDRKFLSKDFSYLLSEEEQKLLANIINILKASKDKQNQ